MMSESWTNTALEDFDLFESLSLQPVTTFSVRKTSTIEPCFPGGRIGSSNVMMLGFVTIWIKKID